MFERNRTGRLNIAYDFAREAAKNYLMGFDAVKRWRLRRPKTMVHDGIDEFLRQYAFPGLDLLLLPAGELDGASVCEIGPGDALASGFSILAAGASNYTAIDRFPGDYSGARAKDYYSKIRDNWHRFYPDIPWDESLRPFDFPEGYPDKVKIICEPIETAKASDHFDIICSFQVAEHVLDIDAFAAIHRRFLKTEGIGLHRVDFGPHDCWVYYRDPMTFLRFPERAWRLTGSNRGVPNRRRHHEFLDAFERAGLNVEVLLIDLFDETTVDFSKLDKRFAIMPRDSLLVGTAVYRLTIN